MSEKMTKPIKRMNHKIRIVEDGLNVGCCKVYIDDQEILGVRGYCIEHEAASVAQLTLYAYANTVVEETGHIEWVATPYTIAEAVEVLKRGAKDGVISVQYIAEILGEILPLLPKELVTGNPAD